MKKLTALLPALLLAGVLAGCGETPSSTPVDSSTPVVENSSTPEETQTKELEAALVGIAKGKTTYLTTVGQADSNIVENLLKKAGATGSYSVDVMLDASAVEEGSVVLLTLGASSKGLGAAGVDEAHEEARAKAFSDAAAEGKFTLILFHVGGTARRGTSSDPIIEAAYPSAAACFVVAAGNEDGFFTTLSATNSVSLYEVEKTVNLKEYVEGLFGIEA